MLKKRLFDLTVRIGSRCDQLPREVFDAIENDFAQYSIEVDKRAWSSANDGTVRIGAALRINAIDLTFPMEVTRKDRSP